MTPQSSFLILARVAAEREPELRRLLASMNASPGRVDANNALVPFAQFDRLHFARFVILDDLTTDDLRLYGTMPPAYPVYLAFLGDVDGDAASFVAELVERAAPGLMQIFGCCDDFAGADLTSWILAHDTPPAANYVNWVGRTVRATRDEAALASALARYVDANAPALAHASPQELHQTLRAFALAEIAAGRLSLTPEAPTPPGWTVRNLIGLIGVPLILLVAAIPLLIVGAIFLFAIRRLEATDPEYCPRVASERMERLGALEDHGVTNQFSAMGSFKPGLIRRWTAVFLLWIVDYGARHVYPRGHLARVQTIHFARWVYLDDKRRLLFASNYDGSLDSYMDDFINKVAFGLNLVFSNGIAYPMTRWLIFAGAKNEQAFKDFLRRHQLPTEVWYNAHLGWTAIDLARNTQIRQGIERTTLSQAEAAAWVALL